MAQGDKLIKLEGLKEVYHTLDGDVAGLKSAMNSVAYVPVDICYVTDGAEGTVHNAHYEKAGRNVLKFTGTASALRYIVVFQGKNGTSNSSTSSPSHNLPQGTYTFFFTGTSKNKLDVCLTTGTYGERVALKSGQTVTVGEGGACVFAKTYQNANYGTTENPTVLTLEIYEGAVSDTTPTAVDNVARNKIAPVLDDMVADTNLSVNDFRLVGNTLYRITASVASGDTLTVGTNCEATTLAEQISAILNS